MLCICCRFHAQPGSRPPVPSLQDGCPFSPPKLRAPNTTHTPEAGARMEWEMTLEFGRGRGGGPGLRLMDAPGCSASVWVDCLLVFWRVVVISATLRGTSGSCLFGGDAMDGWPSFRVRRHQSFRDGCCLVRHISKRRVVSRLLAFVSLFFSGIFVLIGFSGTNPIPLAAGRSPLCG